jgi:hypothetical protein
MVQQVHKENGEKYPNATAYKSNPIERRTKNAQRHHL